jgi:hypothetical protein
MIAPYISGKVKQGFFGVITEIYRAEPGEIGFVLDLLVVDMAGTGSDSWKFTR